MNERDEVQFLLKQMVYVVLDNQRHGVLNANDMDKVVAIYAARLKLDGSAPGRSTETRGSIPGAHRRL